MLLCILDSALAQGTFLLKIKERMASQISDESASHLCDLIQSGPVGKQPVVSNFENCFIIIGNLGRWR